MKIFTYITIGLWAVIQFAAPNLEGCTGIKLVAKDGSVVTGRTVEFGVYIPSSIAIIPRNYDFTGTTPQGKGLTYKTKYGAVGVIADGEVSLLDGINEKGLSVGTFYFPGFAEYATIDAKNQSKALSPIEFPNWLLTQFETIEEVKNAIDQVLIAPTVAKVWGATPAPFHYIVYDKKGKSLVIEPIDGKLEITDNPIGVMTNSPDFDWHTTNLRNYINLLPFNVSPITLRTVTLDPFGQGSGMVGMPGDFTPPSRFVRATIYSSTAISSNDGPGSVFQAFHILNQFDIPVGLIRETAAGNSFDYTLLTLVKDAQSLKYYFRTFEDQTIRMVDLNKFDLDAKVVKQISTVSKQPIVDISANIK